MRTNRIVCMVMAAAMMASAAVAGAAQRKDGDKGTFVGTVAEKAANWVRVLSDNGASEKFQPQWIGGLPRHGGGYDKAMTARIKSLPLGARVEVAWEYDQRLRAVEIRQV